jgi:hypothetical protein
VKEGKKGRAMRVMRAMRARRKMRAMRKTLSNILLSTIDRNSTPCQAYYISNIIWLNRFGASNRLSVGYRGQICNQPDQLHHCIQKARSFR